MSSAVQVYSKLGALIVSLKSQGVLKGGHHYEIVENQTPSVTVGHMHKAVALWDMTDDEMVFGMVFRNPYALTDHLKKVAKVTGALRAGVTVTTLMGDLDVGDDVYPWKIWQVDEQGNLT